MGNAPGAAASQCCEATLTAPPWTGEGGGIFYLWFKAANSSMSI